MAKALVEKSHNLTDGTIQKHIRAITGLKAALDSANGEYRAAVKAAKSDGVKTSQLLAAMSAKKREQEDVTSDLRDYVRYLGLFNMPVTQMDLFGTGGSEEETNDEGGGVEHTRWEAEQAGKKAGSDGRPHSDNPHNQGTELAQAWHTGWSRSQEQLARGKKPGVKAASTRRGRSAALPLN